VSWILGEGVESTNPAKLAVSYLWQIGGNAPDASSADFALGAGSASESIFERRYPFQDAVRLDLRSPLPGTLKKSMSGSSRILYDLGHSGVLLSGELVYAPAIKRSWIIGIGGDLLATRQTEGASEATDFISKYRSNNRVHAGVGYAF
jgi:hypothetical protein